MTARVPSAAAMSTGAAAGGSSRGRDGEQKQGQQKLPGAAGHRHRREEGADRDEPEGAQKGHDRQARRQEGHAGEEGERREQNDLQRQGEQKGPGQLTEEDRARVRRAQEQALHASPLAFLGKEEVEAYP